MERVCKFLKDAGVYYLATVEGDQPRVRPFGTAHIFEGRLYIQTGKAKPCSRQILENPKVELCAFHNGTWVRIAGELAEDDRVEAKKSMLDAYPNLRVCTTKTTAIPRCSISKMRWQPSLLSPQLLRQLLSEDNQKTGRCHASPGFGLF